MKVLCKRLRFITTLSMMLMTTMMMTTTALAPAAEEKQTTISSRRAHVHFPTSPTTMAMRMMMTKRKAKGSSDNDRGNPSAAGKGKGYYSYQGKGPSLRGFSAAKPLSSHSEGKVKGTTSFYSMDMGSHSYKGKGYSYMGKGASLGKGASFNRTPKVDNKGKGMTISSSPSVSPSASLAPSQHPSASPTVSSAPSQRPSASPTVSPSTHPSVVPSTSAAPSSHPSATPSESPSQQPSFAGCTRNVIPFEVAVLIEMEGSPGLISESDISVVEMALLEAYNSVAGCDAPGAFITVTNVIIQVDAVDSFGDDIGTGNIAELSFTWLVLFQGECSGCPATTRAIFAGEDDTAPECACAFPLVSAYVLECNKLIQQFKPGCPVSVTSGTSLLSAPTGGGGGGSSGPFSSFLTITGTTPGLWTSFQIELIGKAIIETYNHANFLNPKNCDTGGRIVTTVTPLSSSVGRRRLQRPPFSIVFEIEGTCSDCGSVTLIFGNHEPGPQDENAICPAGSILQCPSQEEFRDALNDAIDRLEDEFGDELIDVDGVGQSTAPPDKELCTPSPTRAPTAAVPANIDLNGWTNEDDNGNWVIESGANSVRQTVNGDQTFFCSDFPAFGNDLAGAIQVNGGDNDFIGFALGYETSEDADYLLVDWKRRNQSLSLACGSVFGSTGLGLLRVKGIPDGAEFWGHADLSCTPEASVEELARGSTLGSTGWAPGVEYRFRFVFTEGLLQVFVNEILEIAFQASGSESFTDGAFCFYNYSQENVRYSGLTRTIITDPPIPQLTCPPVVSPTIAPTTPSPTSTPTLRPSGESVELCSDNIPVSVTVGSLSNPSGRFVNVPTQQSLENVVDCLDINVGEQHTQTSHVWWNPGPLELVFDFGGIEYNLRDVYFWNYFGETYDVDEIELSFFNLSDELVGSVALQPRLGENANGQNANNIIAEVINLPNVYTASRVNALLKSDNGQIDFQNFVFRAA